MVAVASVLLYVSGCLVLLSQHWLGQIDVPTLLLMIYVAAWSYAGGILVVILMPVCWLICDRQSTAPRPHNIPGSLVRMTASGLHDNHFAECPGSILIESKCSEERKDFREVA
jgi:hypothetical protein